MPQRTLQCNWKNILYRPNGGEGEIQVVAKWYVWGCQEKRWLNVPPVVLRNFLLAAMHPHIPFCVGQIPKNTTDPKLLNPFPSSGDRFRLDLASNSRTHGRFTFSQHPVGDRYFGKATEDQWKRIIYGSILHTGCRKLVYRQLQYIIVDDENRDETGEQLDDPTNNRNWATGDSHAKCSANLLSLLGQPEDDSGEVNLERPVQFRVALFGEWSAKGTVAYNPAIDGIADIAIPLSCLKGNKPKLGNYEGKLLLGLVHEAERRDAKPGWMLFQWITFEVLEADGIISNLEQKCQELAQAYNSITDLARILRIQKSSEIDLEVDGNGILSEREYINTMVRIIEADKNGLLLLHPYVVRRIKQRVRTMWLNLAKAAGVRFYSVMTQPDESLSHYNIVLADGRIQGRKVFCAPDFAPGKYIVFCNPMRHWGDVQLWENRHEGRYTNGYGILAAPAKLLLSLGRDTDGDFVQLIHANSYPNMASAIANFNDPPIVQKLPKEALQGNLQEIAINSMNDLTGVVASLLGRTRAIGAENIVLEIPAGGRQSEPKEMRIIDFLSQELQIAVDSLKSAYPNNEPGLNAVWNFLDGQDADVKWLQDLKEPDVYRDRTCQVNENLNDTVTRIIRIVNSYWRAPELPTDSSPRTYQNVLFGPEHVPFSDFQRNYAQQHRDRYRQDMAQAIAWRDANDGSDEMIREVAAAARTSKPEILETTDENGDRYSVESWVSAYWYICHQAQTGDAGLVFLIFGDEIVAKLQKYELSDLPMIQVFAVQHGDWVAPGWSWTGQIVQIRAVLKEIAGKQRLTIEMKWDAAKRQTGFHHLGIVGDAWAPYIAPGFTETRKIYEVAQQNGLTSRVRLFDINLTDKEIQAYL